MLLITIQFVALFSLVALGFYVFAVDPRRRKNQAFATFNALLAFCVARDILFWNFAEFRSFEQSWIVSGVIAANLMMVALVIFSEDFPENPEGFGRISLGAIAPSAILIPACITGLLWDSFYIFGTAPRLDLRISGYFYAGYLLFLFAWGCYNLISKLSNEADRQTRRQLATILIGLALTASLILLSNVILPWMGYLSLLPFTSVFVIPGVIVNAFAILNLRLFSLQSVLDEIRHFPIAHKVALTVATIAISSFVFLQLPIVLFAFGADLNSDAWMKFIALSLIAALVPNLVLVLAIIRTISRPIKRLTVTALETSKGRYGLEVEGRSTNDEIGILTDAFNKMSRKMAGDISTLRRMNDRLMHTEKLASIGTLSAGIAHEISNPLAAIKSMVEILKSKESMDSESAKQLDTIAKQLDRLSTITREMLDFAVAKSDSRTITDINEVVASSLRLVGFDSSFRDVGIEIHLAGDLPKIHCNPDQMQQVIVNLLLNARQAIENDGIIEIETRDSDAWVIIEVRDTGCGIPEEDASRIFDPFFTTKADTGGTGLGLAVSYGIIQSHKGSLEAVENIPRGTILRISLPKLLD
jgi:two-component system NtrC family sensor kinase